MTGPWDEDDDEPEEEFEPGISRRRRGGGEQRGNWYLLTGLILGLALGLLIAWVISPVQYTDTDPSSLSSSDKDRYRQVIALAYAADHDLIRAQERLKLLAPDNPVQILAAQAQRMLANNQSPQEARALAVLAADIGKPGGQSGATATLGLITPAAGSTATPAPGADNTQAPEITEDATSQAAAVQTPTLPVPTQTQTPTLTPLPTFTPRPTATSLPVVDTLFTLKGKQEICSGSVQPGMLKIQVNDAKGKPLPGVKILITWQNGQDTFYTGLAPEINAGYADFLMSPGVVYSLRVGEVSQPVNNLKIGDCGGGWSLTFEAGG